MNRNDLQKHFDNLGGLKEWARLAKKDVRTRLDFFSKVFPKLQGADVVQHREPDPQAGEKFQAAFLQTVNGILAARKRGDLNTTTYKSGHQESGVTIVVGAANTDVTNRPGVSEHGNPNTTPHGITNTTAPQALLHSKPDVVIPKPVVAAPLTPEEAKRRAMAPLPQSPRNGPSTTELFLSPPRNWSGW
jgi:hypothetical protein